MATAVARDRGLMASPLARTTMGSRRRGGRLRRVRDPLPKGGTSRNESGLPARRRLDERGGVWIDDASDDVEATTGDIARARVWRRGGVRLRSTCQSIHSNPFTTERFYKSDRSEARSRWARTGTGAAAGSGAYLPSPRPVASARPAAIPASGARAEPAGKPRERHQRRVDAHRVGRGTGSARHRLRFHRSDPAAPRRRALHG